VQFLFYTFNILPITIQYYTDIVVSIGLLSSQRQAITRLYADATADEIVQHRVC